MKTIISFVLTWILFVTCAAAESANELAIKIIKSEFHGICNSSENSVEDDIRVGMSHAPYILSRYMLDESTPNRIRVAYAMKLQKERIETAKLLLKSDVFTDLSSLKSGVETLENEVNALAIFIAVGPTEMKNDESN